LVPSRDQTQKSEEISSRKESGTKKTWAEGSGTERESARWGWVKERVWERTLSLVGEEGINLGSGSVVSDNLESPERRKQERKKVSERGGRGRRRRRERTDLSFWRERWDGKGVGESEPVQRKKSRHLSTLLSLQ